MYNTSPIVILYDIHGNLTALRSVLNEVSESDIIVVGGDVIVGPNSNECMDLFYQIPNQIYFIKGNCETSVLDFIDGRPLPTLPSYVKEQIKWTARSLSSTNIQHIRSWPMSLKLEHPSLGRLAFFHAAPGNENAIFTQETNHRLLTRIFQNVDANIIFTGHTHIQFDISINNKRIVNAGSVGMSFQGPGAFFCLVDQQIRLRKLDYNLNTTSDQMRQSAFPHVDDYINNFILHPPKKEDMLKVYKQTEWQS